jgi:hypothetical protein
MFRDATAATGAAAGEAAAVVLDIAQLTARSLPTDAQIES